MLAAEGIIRVDGRLQRSDFDLRELNPIFVPGNNHIAKHLVLHFHKMTHHQGRHITERAIRSTGLWITGAKRLVSSVIYKCVSCRQGHRKLLTHKMADHGV